MPALEALERWTKALDIPLYQLFYGEPVKRVNGESDFLRDRKHKQLRNVGLALKKMSPRDRLKLFAVAQQVAAKISRKRSEIRNCYSRFDQPQSMRGIPASLA